MKGFCEETLGSIANPSRGGLVDGPFGSNLPASEYVEEGVPVLRGSNLSIGPSYLKENEFVFVSRELTEKLARSICRQGDIVFTKKGTLGQTGFISESSKFKEYLLSSNQMKISVDCRKAIPKYVYYYVSSPSSISKIIRDAEATGVPKTNVAYLKTFPILLPSISEQQAILDMIAPLDDKIELNWRMNETLEAMARAVFRDWFVDFGPTRRKAAGETDPGAILGGLLPDPTQATPVAALFPDSFGDNGLPEGWQKRTLGDVVEPRKGRNITKKTVVPGDVPVVAGGLNPAYYHSTPNVTGPVITASASGANAGFVRLYHQDIWASDCSFISREQTDYLFTIYALLSSRQDEIYSMQQGAAQPHIYPSDLKRLPISDAPEPVWQSLEKFLAPMFEMVANNEKENQTLAATRDLLLPKLMSGEIRLVEEEGVA
ncbi:restriction endonuclease subunit S [Thioclava litoralis]|uniref:Restriction endonuclease subunit S n=1 Tax=Thioclava litoralis TaxID=3076557 RepID=A0ABZ1E471_9RHOB|nr:restriction endonuclease subunit S [Thioclava sp. FTW29]